MTTHVEIQFDALPFSDHILRSGKDYEADVPHGCCALQVGQVMLTLPHSCAPRDHLLELRHEQCRCRI